MKQWTINSVKVSLFSGMVDELCYIDGHVPRETLDRNLRVLEHIQQYSGWPNVRAIREEMWRDQPFARWIQERVIAKKNEVTWC